MSRIRSAVRSRTSAALLAAFSLALAAGCTEKLVEPPPPVFGVPDSIQEVFTNHCAIVGCHAGSLPQQGMGLTDPRTSWLAIVGVPAVELSGTFQRIAPGDSANSY